MSVHEKSKGYHSGARDYVAGRPGYPPEAIEWLRDVLGVAPGRKIVEIGAGTGKFIPTLSEVGGTIIAVEPITEMRERWCQSDAKRSPLGAVITRTGDLSRRATATPPGRRSGEA